MFAEMKTAGEKKAAKGKKTGDDASTGVSSSVGSASPLVLPDVRASVFAALIEFIYSNSCTLTPSTVG